MLLDVMGADVEHNPYIPYLDLKLLHFSSLVLTDDDVYGAYLVFENNFDGQLDQYLDDLYAHAAEGLHRIYSCCLDYPAGSVADKAQMLSYLRAHVVHPNAYHIGNVGRSVVRTQQEDALRDGLEDFLDEVVAKGDVGPASWIRQKIQAFVRKQAAFAWAANIQPRQTPLEYALPRLKLAVAAVIALLLLPILIPPAIVWIVMLRWTETHEPAPPELDVKEHVKELVKREDRTHIVQNHMCSITTVKPGLFRRTTLWGVLWLINLLARTFFDKGELNGIPSIHFAHWSMIDNGRRLLFVSNFDGSWENYLDDFIDKAAFGLTAIWTNTSGFPKTSWLVCEGARDGSRFKAYARASMTYTNVWYSAYKQSTVQTIDNNSGIREDLFRTIDVTAARNWVRRF
jgi:hypothetical protein